MNVVLEQIRRKFDVSKDVLHYIIEFFRPRAPYIEELNGWEKWKCSLGWGTTRWYNWYIRMNFVYYYTTPTTICLVCKLCLKPIISQNHSLCVMCWKAQSITNENSFIYSFY